MSTAVRHSAHELEVPGFHGSWSSYLRRLWERREFAWYVPHNDLRSQQMNTVLGNLWHLLNPLLSIGVYYVIFGLLLKTNRGIDSFIPFLAVGVFVYSFTQKSTMAGASSIVRNLGLVRSINFPRALMPLTSVITEALAFLPGVLVFLTVSVIAGNPPTWRWMLLLPVFALQLLFNFGAACLAARATHLFRDVENLLPFFFRLAFYGSGVLFSVDAYLERDRLKWLFFLNPMFNFVELYRWAVLGIGEYHTELLAASTFAVVTPIVGLWWFRRAESRYGA